MANPSLINPDFILASYSPPETTLEPPKATRISTAEAEFDEIDDYQEVTVPFKVISEGQESTTVVAFPATLNAAPVPYVEKSRHASPSFSSIEPSNRSQKVTNLDVAPLFSNAGVRGMVTTVSHGTFHSRPATLIVFSFVFRSGGHGFRFKNSNIKITFADFARSSSASGSKSPSTTSSSPSVVKFAPRKVFGLPTVEGKKNSVGGDFSLEVPAGPVVVGPSVSWGKEWEFELTHRFSTVGNFWSSRHGTDWDIVYWDIKENKRTAAGIPDQFNCAVVVEREDGVGAKLPFTATVEVTVDTPLGNGFFSRPWSRERPVTFVEGVEMGRQHFGKEFEKLSEEEWRILAPFDAEWQNRFTDVAMNKRESSAKESVPESLQSAAKDQVEEGDDR